MVLDVQKVIGSDIMMILDQCVEYPAEKSRVRAGMDRTIRWAKESREHYEKHFDKEKQACFAIVQGGTHHDLRKECAKELLDLDFPGYAIGGLSVGEPKEMYRDISAIVTEILPDDRPRYMMGVGSPMEILDSIAHGVDMFDCVMPTRIARNGTMYTTQGRLNLKNAQFEKDFSPLDPGCDCFVCRNYTRAYLRHIFKMQEITSAVYNTYHNLYFMRKFILDIQKSLDEGSFSECYAKWSSFYG
jgi:queuine tRNA-ribosyltransferase